MLNETLIERAFTLAKSGKYQGLSDIRRRLGEEGYTGVSAALFGKATKTTLQRLCREARQGES